MESVPFQFDNVHAGFSTCAGLLRLEDGGIRCEYRVDVGGFGVKGRTQESRLGFDEIESIEFRKGWIGAKAILRPANLALLERFPASGDESLVLHFRRKDRTRADLLVSEIDLRLARYRLAHARNTDR